MCICMPGSVCGYVCVCVCVCEREREREKEREGETERQRQRERENTKLCKIDVYARFLGKGLT